MLKLCKKCMLISGLLWLLFGILFLLQNLNIWNFWNIQWWTVVFLLLGINILAARFCPKCQELN